MHYSPVNCPAKNLKNRSEFVKQRKNLIQIINMNLMNNSYGSETMVNGLDIRSKYKLKLQLNLSYPNT